MNIPSVARRSGCNPGSPLSVAGGVLTSRQSSGGVDGLAALPARRRSAVRKAFKRLDPKGSGQVALTDAMLALAAAPTLSTSYHEELKKELTRCAAKHEGAHVLSLQAFVSYYVTVSGTISSDTEFEQLLESQWGYPGVSETLDAMQRQFAQLGFNRALQDGGFAGQRGAQAINLNEFECLLQKAGIKMRPDNLQNVFDAFKCSENSLGLHDLSEEMLSPRPQTPKHRSAQGTSAVSAGEELDRLHERLQELKGKRAEALVNAAMSQGHGSSTSAPTMMEVDAELHEIQQQLCKVKARASRDLLKSPQRDVLGMRSTGSLAQDGPPPTDAELDEALNHVHGKLQHLKGKKADAIVSAAMAQAHGTTPPDDLTTAQLDLELEALQSHLSKLKEHKSKVASHSAPLPALQPVELPHWEHHKYGHHEVTSPAWKPEAKVTDMFGNQHAASEYHYSNFGAGAHGHHLAHYHLNDYHGLAHHSFKPEEYHKQQFGDAAHHGHWVPHLHGLGTAGHHGEHAYKADDYANQSYGKPGHHNHWVPHLHGIGGSGSST